MKNEILSLFIITKKIGTFKNEPMDGFLSTKYDNAKLYFKSYLMDKKNKNIYTLYKIGEITKDLKILEKKIYITGGYETEFENKINFGREEIKEQKKLYEEASRENNTKDILKMLFRGNEIC